MNKQTEALKMAIEALEDAQKSLDGQFSCGNCYTNVIQACKKALEQPSVAQLNDEYLRDTHVDGLEQPTQDYGDWFPIGLDAETGNCNHDRYAEGWNDCLNKCWEAYDRYKNCPIEQPAQEPVAWMHRHDGEITEFNDFQSCQYCEPLYTHPAPSWQRLSDDEINDIKTKTIMGANGMSVEQLLGLIVSLTEQALRNKNGY